MSYMGMGENTKAEWDALDDFFDNFLHTHDEIWIYGVEKYGTGFYRYLHECDEAVTGFVVGSPEEKKKMFGLPVMEVEEFRQYYLQMRSEKKIGCLFAIPPSLQGEAFAWLNIMQMDGRNDLYIVQRRWLRLAAMHCLKSDSFILVIQCARFCTGIACYGCSTGAPINPREVYDISTFQEDINCLKKLIGERIAEITFTGGDAFLNPNFVDFVEYARLLFPKVKLNVGTSGVSLVNQKDKVWERLGKCNVTFQWTLYPIHYPDMSEVAKKIAVLGNGGIHLLLTGDSGGESKSSWHMPYTFQRQKKRDWLFCGQHKCGNGVIQLWDGRVYVCKLPFHGLIERFGERISEEFQQVSAPARISLKIKELKNAAQIDNFITSYLPICGYCALRKWHSIGKWLPSTGAFEEWFIDDVGSVSGKCPRERHETTY